MRLQLIADLHLERYPDFVPQAATGVDVLVLAGDIGSYQMGSRLTAPDFGLTRFSPRQPDSPWANAQVVFVPGNHEFDGLELDEATARLRRLCEALGIVWLERQAVVLGGVRFVGTTLWSDFDALAAGETDPAKRLKQREKAFRAANFYLRKNTTLQGGTPVLAESLREMSLACQDWLRRALDAPFEGRTVVVTHFAPSLRSADPRYGLVPGTAGFCNAHDELLARADLWLHGHLHCPNDYVVTTADSRGGERLCRVVANPRGYASKDEQAAFVEGLVIEL